MPFPFLGLPNLIQQHVVRKCKKQELILLSFCSQKTRKLVTSANIPHGFLDVRFKGNLLVLRIGRFGDTTTLIVQETVVPDSETSSFNGSPLFLDIPKTTCYVIWQHSFKETSKLVLDHIMKVFGSDKPPATVHTDVGNLLNIPFGEWDVGEVEVCDYESPLNREQVTFLLDELEMTDRGRLNICAKVEGVTGYSTGFRHHTVTVQDADWLHLDAILNSQSTIIRIFQMPASPTSQLSRLLKDWMSMDRMKELQEVMINFTSSTLPMEVMRGIESHWRQGPVFKIRRVNQTEGHLRVQENFMSLILSDRISFPGINGMADINRIWGL